MAVSFSRPDPSSPAAVASAGFPTVRRGFDPTEVRDFLRMVAAELGRLQERERYLERELQTLRQHQKISEGPLDEETVTELLGEETARVLATAREAAVSIRTKSEEGAARLLREAQEEATSLREQVDLEIARKRDDAHHDAEAQIEQAKQQGRDMVAEARDYRERVLADLSRRRELARQQLQQLASGRERLSQVFERARLAAVDVLGELVEIADEPDEMVNLASTTGPVPIMVPIYDDRAHEAPAAVAEAPAPSMVMRIVDPEIVDEDPAPAGAGDSAAPEAELDVVVATDPDESVVIVAAPDDAAEGQGVGPDVDAGDGLASSEPGDATQPIPTPLAPVVALFAGELASVEPPSTEAPDADGGGDPTVAVSVDDLFARLRASSAEEVARAAEPAGSAPDTSTDGPAPDDEPSPFMLRDDVLAPIIVRLARKLKRVLADEQNDVLDVLRRKEPVKNLDALLPWEAAHVDAYRTAIGDEALDAALAGAAAMAPQSVKRHRRRISDAGIVSAVVDSVGDVIVALRERLDHSIGENEGDNVAIGNHVRAIYREWKTQRLDDAAIALAHAAYARAGAAVLQPGTMVIWVPDPSAPTCEEAAMNVAAGPIAMGESFPSGHRTPPAHDTCRCLLVEIDR